MIADLDEQISLKAPTMLVADYVAFAEGAESYLEKKYGDSLAMDVMACPAYWIGVSGYKTSMASLWVILDDETRDKLKHIPLQAVIDEKISRTLPSGGKFQFKE